MTTSYRNRRLLVMGGGPMQVEAFAVARRLGIRTVCVDPDRNAECSSLADSFYSCDLADMRSLKKVASREDIDSVVTLAADYPLPAASLLCEELGLPGPSPHAVAIVCNKVSLRKQIQLQYMAAPKWERVESLEEACGSRLINSVPCVVKPADSSGGRGVGFVAVGAAQVAIVDALDAALQASKVKSAIVEEFVDGPEFSVEAITARGTTTLVAVTKKSTSGPPFFLEIGHAVPAALSDDETSSIARLVFDVVAGTGIDDCASHLELKLTPGGPVLIEVAARLGGGFINTDLVPLALGVDIVRAVIDVALGYPPSLRTERVRGAAIRFMIPPPGVLESIEGFQDVEKGACVHRAVCLYQPGETIPLIRDATGRKAYVISRGADSGEAWMAAEEAAASVVFRMRA